MKLNQDYNFLFREREHMHHFHIWQSQCTASCRDIYGQLLGLTVLIVCNVSWNIRRELLISRGQIILLCLRFPRCCSWNQGKSVALLRHDVLQRYSICSRRGQRSMSYRRTFSPSSPIKRLSVRRRSSPGKASSHRWKDSSCQWSSNSLPRRPPKVNNVLEWQFLICVKWVVL